MSKGASVTTEMLPDLTVVLEGGLKDHECALAPLAPFDCDGAVTIGALTLEPAPRNVWLCRRHHDFAERREDMGQTVVIMEVEP